MYDTVWVTTFPPLTTQFYAKKFIICVWLLNTAKIKMIHNTFSCQRTCTVTRKGGRDGGSIPSLNNTRTDVLVITGKVITGKVIAGKVITGKIITGNEEGHGRQESERVTFSYGLQSASDWHAKSSFMQ